MAEESAMIEAMRSTAQAAGSVATAAEQLIVNILILGGKAFVFGSDKGAKAAVKAVRLGQALYYGKWHGQANLHRLQKIKGDNLAYFEVGTEDKGKLKKIRDMAKKSGLLFCQLPDFKVNDGKTQFCFSANDLPVFNVFLKAYNEGVKNGIIDSPISVISEEDYAMTGFSNDGQPVPELAKLEESAKEEIARQKEAENRKNKRKKAQKKSGSADKRKTEISVNKVLYSENLENTIIRVPGTNGKIHFLANTKADVRTVSKGNIAVGIDPSKQYARCDRNGVPTGESISGEEIIKRFNHERKKDFFHSINKNGQSDRSARIVVDKGNIISRTEHGYILDIPGSRNLAAFVPNSSVVAVNKADQPIINTSAKAYVFDKTDFSKQQEARLSSFAKALTSSREKNLASIKNLKNSMMERGQDLRLTFGNDMSENLGDFLRGALRR